MNAESNPLPSAPPAQFTTVCTDEELQLACLRWTAGALAVLIGIITAPPCGDGRKFLGTRLNAILSRLIRRGPCGIARYLLASTVEKMLENLTAQSPRGVARELYLNALAIVDTANEDPRPAMKELLPVAEGIRDAARELMLDPGATMPAAPAPAAGAR